MLHRINVSLVSAMLVTVAAVPISATAQPPSRPNVLVIFIDDLGYSDLGVTGSKRTATPNIDSIARNGVQFTNSYVTGPVCSPSRAALLSGRYQQRFGMDFLADGSDPADRGGPRAMDLRETTIAQRLRAQGYATGMVGKWHIAEITTTASWVLLTLAPHIS